MLTARRVEVLDHRRSPSFLAAKREREDVGSNNGALDHFGDVSIPSPIPRKELIVRMQMVGGRVGPLARM